MAQFAKTIAIQNQSNRASADKAAQAQKNWAKDKVAAVDVDGSTTIMWLVRADENTPSLQWIQKRKALPLIFSRL